MKNFVLTLFVFSLFMVSCQEETCTECPKKIAQAQLLEDYSDYEVSNITWNQQREYYVASFTLTEKTVKSTEGIQARAWYDVNGNSAKRVRDSKSVSEVPEIIKAAFEATPYSNPELWKIEEIELDEDFLGNTFRLYYEMDLKSVTDPTLEAELIFDAKTGELLYSKEEKDKDYDDDKFIVDESLKAAVEKLYPGAVIISAEYEDGYIEVDALWTKDGKRVELELYFTLKYEFVGESSEQKYTYAEMPAEFATVKAWFQANTQYPEPPATTPVEIEKDIEKGAVIYEVDFEEYAVNGKVYEASFTLDKDYKVIEAEVEEED